jgi:hypothetical protein
MKKTLTSEVESNIVRDYLSGNNSSSVGMKYGIGGGEVLDVVKRSGRSPRSPGRQAIRVNDSYFDNIDTDKKAYWLGFLSADGCVYGNRIVMTLSSIDGMHLEKLLRDLDCDGTVKNYPKTYGDKKGTYSQIGITSTQLTQSLIKVGVTERKSLTLMPWAGPPELMPAYFRGLMDGDGSYCIDKRGMPSVSLVGSLGVVSEFARFFTDLIGGKVSISPQKNIWCARITKAKHVQEFCRIIMTNAEVWLDRKKEKIDKILAGSWRNCDLLSRFDEIDLIQRLIKFADWSAVAADLGIQQSNLWKLRKRYGLDRLWKGYDCLAKANSHLKPVDRSDVTPEALINAYRECGSWSKAESVLRIPKTTRKRFIKKLFPSGFPYM